MNLSKRVGIGLAAASGVTALLAGPALAAPTNAPRAMEFRLTCSNGITYDAAAPPGGSSMNSRSVTPAIVLSPGHGVLIPTTITFTFDGEPPFTVMRGQGNPNANELSCSATLPFGTVSASGFLAGGGH